MKKSLIALGLTAILSLGATAAFSFPTVSTEQSDKGKKCKKKKKCCKKGKECKKGEKKEAENTEEKSEG